MSKLTPAKAGNSKKIAVVSPRCVSCGCCLKICPFDAISIPTGIIAMIDADKCVGCGKCTKICPANIITITPIEEVSPPHETSST